MFYIFQKGLKECVNIKTYNTTKKEMARVSCKERDFLEQDPPIRGQNYACLSFLFPEDVIINKEAFVFSRFLKDISGDLRLFFDNSMERFKDDVSMVSALQSIKERYDYLFSPQNMDAQYKFFKDIHGDDIDKEYTEANDFITNIRGIKIRGVYDSLVEAQNRAQHIKKMDPKFNLMIGQVGCWCPLSPNVNDIENQEYCETELNTLMKKYKENIQESDMYYQSRKDEMVKTIKDNNNGVNHSMDEQIRQDYPSTSQEQPVKDMVDTESDLDLEVQKRKQEGTK